MASTQKRVRSDGSIRYQVRYLDNTAKSGFSYRSFSRAKAAKAFECEKTLEEENTGLQIPQKLSVQDAVELWLNICEKIGRDGREPVEMSTLVEYMRRAKVIQAYHWNKFIHELTALDFVQFRNWLLENHSRDLAKRTLSSFQSIMIEMKLQGNVLENPGSGITIKTGGRFDAQNSEVDIPSDQELKDLLGAADIMGQKNDFMRRAWVRYRPMIYLPVFSGLRASEVRGLPWHNVSKTSVKVTQRADKFRNIGPVKSKAGFRKIELSTKVTDIVFEWREQCHKSKYNLVFPTQSGLPIDLNNFQTDAWLPLFREADLMIERTVRGVRKLRPKYTYHGLRHYFASKLLEKNKDIKFIQNRMGHSSAEITLNTYGHLMKDREIENQNVADELAGEFF